MSWQGSVASIYIAPRGGVPTVSLEQSHVVPGKGLVGDRYFTQTGTWSFKPEYFSELTLIEAETLEALLSESGIQLTPAESRRNIVTRGVPLNHLVGREFRVGAVLLRGERLCEPCSHLEKLTVPGVRAGLVHRGGLRAYVLTEGDIKVGDPIEEAHGDA